MAATDAQPAQPAQPAQSAPAPTRRVWPVTAALVVTGLVVLLFDAFIAAISTAPFFGDAPGRERYIEAGVVLLTALVPVALLTAIGLLCRCRWGLLLMVVPALLLALVGATQLAEDGDPTDEGYGRALRPGDLVDDSAWLNGLSSAVALLVLAVLVWRARRNRPGAAT